MTIDDLLFAAMERAGATKDSNLAMAVASAIVAQHAAEEAVASLDTLTDLVAQLMQPRPVEAEAPPPPDRPRDLSPSESEIYDELAKSRGSAFAGLDLLSLARSLDGERIASGRPLSVTITSIELAVEEIADRRSRGDVTPITARDIVNRFCRKAGPGRPAAPPTEGKPT